MAPIMTAVELTLSPTDAMNIANINIHGVAPESSTPSLIWALNLHIFRFISKQTESISECMAEPANHGIN